MKRAVWAAVAVLTLSAGMTLVTATTASTPAEAATCNIGRPASAYAQEVAWSAKHAQVWRLYQAFFLRQPDRQGFEYWMRVRAGGASMSTIAHTFASGREFKIRYGTLSNSQYVTLVYQNVLCRTPDASGKRYWIDLLNSGRLSRWDMVLNFVELREYLRRTATCHSSYFAEAAAVNGCPEAGLQPAMSADLTRDGYRHRSVSVRRVGGGTGSFRGIEVDMRRRRFETGQDRCRVASINANWTVAAEKDRPNPAAIGIGVVDGVHVKGSWDRTDRGVFGLRFDADPTNVVEVWPGDTLSPDDTKLSSVAFHSGRVSIESWRMSAESSPYLKELAPHEQVAAHEWAWAAAGVPLRVDGQTDKDFMQAYYGDPYTHQTRRHPFVAVDQNSRRLIFGATSNLDTRDLVVWAENHGYEDLIKFDGGGSAEFNIGRKAVVAGTNRDLPVWLGIGC